MNISDFDYDLPEERIAKFPVEKRDASKLLVWRGGEISETVFSNIGSALPEGCLLVFNNTRVVRARLVMHKAGVLLAKKETGGTTMPGARIEILCLEPVNPADYERAFAARGHCEWNCMVGNSKKWKSGPVEIPYIYGGSEHRLQAWRNRDVIARGATPKQSREERLDCFGHSPRNDVSAGGEQTVRFEWDSDVSFGELLELLGRMPIPPYLGRDSEEVDNTRYQTVFARIEGSVAAPTAGLHFTPELISRLQSDEIEIEHITLHVGAGTFLPVKTENALDHPMHTEHFEVTLATLLHLISAMEEDARFSSECAVCNAVEESARECTESYMTAAIPQTKEADGTLSRKSRIIAVGTTSVRTLESLTTLGWRISQTDSPEADRPVGQFEPYDIPAGFDGKTALETLAGYMHIRGLDKIAASTRIMITPGYRFRIVNGIITNFHQPKSTLLLLISAFVGDDNWQKIYDYALSHDFRFLSYGDSSLLLQ